MLAIIMISSDLAPHESWHRPETQRCQVNGTLAGSAFGGHLLWGEGKVVPCCKGLLKPVHLSFLEKRGSWCKQEMPGTRAIWISSCYLPTAHILQLYNRGFGRWPLGAGYSLWQVVCNFPPDSPFLFNGTHLLESEYAGCPVPAQICSWNTTANSSL